MKRGPPAEDRAFKGWRKKRGPKPPARLERGIRQMKLIKLSQGQFAKVDDCWFERLNQHKWCARYNPSTDSYYAQRTIYPGGRKGATTIQMHREILGFLPRDGKQCDHRNGDTLDNQVLNLRDGSDGNNEKNRARNKNNTSGLKGVSWRKQANKWIAQIQNNGKKEFLGYHTTKEAAHAAYCEAATRLHGDFAKTA
jgi:hypothetical protein